MNIMHSAYFDDSIKQYESQLVKRKISKPQSTTRNWPPGLVLELVTKIKLFLTNIAGSLIIMNIDFIILIKSLFSQSVKFNDQEIACPGCIYIYWISNNKKLESICN